MARNPSPPPDLSAEESALLEATLNPVALVATLQAVIDELQRIADRPAAAEHSGSSAGTGASTGAAKDAATSAEDGETRVAKESSVEEDESVPDSALVVHLCTLLEATSLVGRATDAAAVEQLAELVPPVMMAVLEQADDDRTVEVAVGVLANLAYSKAGKATVFATASLPAWICKYLAGSDDARTLLEVMRLLQTLMAWPEFGASWLPTMVSARAIEAVTAILANTLSEPLLVATAEVAGRMLAVGDAALVNARDRAALADRITDMLSTEPWSDTACVALVWLLADVCVDDATDTVDAALERTAVVAVVDLLVARWAAVAEGPVEHSELALHTVGFLARRPLTPSHVAKLDTLVPDLAAARARLEAQPADALEDLERDFRDGAAHIERLHGKQRS